MRKLVLFILITFFSLSSLAAALSDCSGACPSEIESRSAQDNCSESETAAQSNEPHQSHQDDPHCSLHRLGCCSPILLGTIQRALTNIEVASVVYSDKYLILKPDPSLDGPFQPPRS